ncbi:NUDIX domain protein [compost metagenome]
MPIVTNQKGDVFEEYMEISEDDLKTLTLDHPLTHALVIAKYEDKYLLLYNRWRKEWEVPGGMIDKGESCRECAVRELFEETNQQPGAIVFNGLMKFNLHTGKTEYGALYSVRLDQVTEFTENNEAVRITFWNGIDEFSNINAIDRKLLEFYKEP